MTSASDSYLLSDSASELERLRLQAKVWEPAAEAMLDQIGIKAGWSCVDLGCGALGILGPLSRRVGSAGRVVGVDVDARQLAAARAHVLEQGLENVAVLERDAYRTTLPRESFDFTHVRFLFAPVGRDEELLTEIENQARENGGSLEISNDVHTAFDETEVVYAKSWGSKNFYGDANKDIREREVYRRRWIVDEKKMARTNDAIFMHCLPVRRNVIVTDGVIDSPRSVVIDEAENRLHVQKAIMAKLIG